MVDHDAGERAVVLRRSREFALPPHPILKKVIPDWRMVKDPARGKLMAIPHTVATTRLARNCGFIVPAPITCHYDWVKDTPFKIQKITAAMLTMQPRAYVLSAMGTGKTRSALYAADYLLKEGEIRNVLVVAPLSTLSAVWDREIFEFFPHLTTAVLHGTKSRREALLERQHDVYIINHDGVKVLREPLLNKDIDAIIVDEVGMYRTHTTERWKCLNPILNKAKYAWGMTGSPTPNAPTDAYGIAKMFTPKQVPKYFRQFQRQTMNQITQFKWVAKQEANSIVHEVLQPAVRFTRDDCIELPETVYADREVKLEPETQKVYEDLMKKLHISFNNGEVTAANEGVLFSKLLQIASGWVYTKDKDAIELPNKGRIQEVIDIIEGVEGKVIVFAAFTHTVTKLEAILRKKAGMDTALVTGATPKSRRDEIFGDFQNHPSPRVIVAHPGCMSHGLTLTEASTIVWVTPSTSLETYEQACARITRPGQKRKQLIIHLSGTQVEKKLYSRLKQKASLQGALLEMFNDTQAG